LSGFTVGFLWFLLFFGGGIFLAYQRIDLRTSTVATGFAVATYLFFGDGHWLWNIALIAAFGVMIIPNLIEFRREKLTKPLLTIYRSMLPSMSDTEREALEAGSVWWDGEVPAKNSVKCSMTGIFVTSVPTCRKRSGTTSSRNASSR